MPSFFRRRYMRGEPRKTERFVGAFVLVLLALILGLFALTSGLFAGVVDRVPLLTSAKRVIGLSERPLFLADPKNATPPAPPHQLREAAALLPESIGDWKRGAVEVHPVAASGAATSEPALAAAGAAEGEEPSADGESAHSEAADANASSAPSAPAPTTLDQALSEFSAAASYRATYTHPDAAIGAINVAIADATDAPGAFGLASALRPASAKPAALGAGGWRDEKGDRLGIWAGRFYTDLSFHKGSAEPDADPAKTARADFLRGLSARQLVYGPPFWSQSVLPREGQVEQSFRFVRKNALGIADLNDCWLADYASGLTLGVTQPADARKFLANTKTSLASMKAPTPPVAINVLADLDNAPEALAAASVAYQVGDRILGAFDAGPYVFVVSAPAAQQPLIASTARMLHDRWTAGAALAQTSSPGSPAAPAAGLARFADVDGVDAPAKVERYTDNLYEKIDGREPMFRSFGFVELRFGQYLDTRAKQAFDVYIYDMAEPNNALGIFMKERSNATASAGVGRDSYVSGANVYFWKARYYVNVLAPADATPAIAAAARKIASAIADTIAGQAETFWAEDVLPREDRVADSFKYIASAALNYDFFNRVYRADYKSGDKGYTLFVRKCADAKAAHELFTKIADASKKYGDKIEQRVDTPGSELLVSSSSDIYMIVVSRGVFVGGVTECEDKDLALAKANLLTERMPLDAAGEPEPANVPSANEAEDGGHGY